jgi:hypothetical protein
MIRFVPRSKHTSSRLYKPNSYNRSSSWKTVQNTYKYSAAIRDVSDFLCHVDEIDTRSSDLLYNLRICLAKFRDCQPVPSSTAKHSL